MVTHVDKTPPRHAIWLLSSGHLCVDIAQGALPALLPFLMVAHGMKIAAAGGLVFAMSAGSSVIQPLFGYFADRLSKPWLMSLGLLFTGLGISLAGLMSAYWAIALAVAICGLGIAAFHPEGARLANHAAGEHKTVGMSIFSVGGNVGFACGPLLAAGVYTLCGLHGTLLLTIPPFAMAIILLSQIRHFAVPQPPAQQANGAFSETLPDAWGAFSWLSLAVVARSIIFYALITFLPLWLHVLGMSKEAGSAMLTVFFGVGALGTLLGGRLAGRMGYRNLMKVGFLLLFPLLYLWLHTRSVIMAVVMLVPLAFIYYAPFSAIVVLGQQYLPNRLGFASGVTLGLAVSIGGVMQPFLGHWADLHGIMSALYLIVPLPIICALIAFTLPKPPQARQQEAKLQAV